MNTLTVDYSSAAADAAVKELFSLFTGSKRAALHERIAAHAEALTRGHIATLAREKHGTAQQLGVAHTGFYSLAVNAISVSANASAAELGIAHPGFARALRTVELRPVRAKALTIAIAAESYGKRAGEFGKLESRRTRKGQTVLGRRDEQGAWKSLFLLVSKVTQKQDRALLPSMEAYQAAAVAAATQLAEEELAAAATKS